MKTMENLTNMLLSDRYQKENELRGRVWVLERIYAETIGGKPSVTIGKFVDSVGLHEAVETVATLVSRYLWDGRISIWVKDWAENQPDAWNTEAAREMRIGTDMIHLAHLNQLAEALMRISQ